MEISIATSDPGAIDPEAIARAIEGLNLYVGSVDVNDGERHWATGFTACLEGGDHAPDSGHSIDVCPTQKLSDAPYEVGDDDPTPDLPEFEAENYCQAEHTTGVVCTWSAAEDIHPDWHVAGNGESVVAVWHV